jgi:hypothetical protein
VIKIVNDLLQKCCFLRVFWFPPPKKTDRHHIAEILLILALSNISLTLTPRGDHIGDVMTALGVINSWFDPWSNQTKCNKIGLCCFSAKHATLYCGEWANIWWMRVRKMYQIGTTCLLVDRQKVTHPPHNFAYNSCLFLPWYNWKRRQLELISLTPPLFIEVSV